MPSFLRTRLVADPVLGSDFSPGPGGVHIVSLNNPEEMGDNSQRGISLWLYRVVRDDQLLNRGRERMDVRLEGHRDLPLRLHYLVTPISAIDPDVGPQTEQMLLGKVLQVFHDQPVLRGSDVIPTEELAGEDIRIHVRLETLSLEEITRIWETLDRSYQLCVSYEVSVVTICSAREPESVTPVEVVAPEHSVIVSSSLIDQGF